MQWRWACQGKRTSESFLLNEEDSGQTLTRLGSQYNTGLGRTVLKPTVQLTFLDMSKLMFFCCQSIIASYYYTRPRNILIEQWTIGRDLPGRMNHNSIFYTSTEVRSYAIFRGNCCSLLCSRSYTDRCWRHCTLWSFLGPGIFIEQTVKSAGYLNITVEHLHSYMISIFPNEKKAFE